MADASITIVDEQIVVVPFGSELLSGMIDQAEAAVVEAEAAAVAAANSMGIPFAALGSITEDIVTETVGTTTPDTTTLTSSTEYWSNAAQVTQDGVLASVSVRLASATNFDLLVVDEDGVVLAEASFVGPNVGINTNTYGNIRMPAGSRLFARQSSGAGWRFAALTSGARFFAAADYTGTPGDTVPFTNANFEFALSYVVNYVPQKGLQEQVTDNGEIARTAQLVIGDTSPATSVNASASFYFAQAEAVPRDCYLEEVSIRFAGASVYRLLVVSAASVVLWDRTYRAPDLGVHDQRIDEAVFMPSGSRLFVQPTSGAGYYYVGSGGAAHSFPTSDYTGVLGDTVTVTAGNPTAFAIAFKVGFAPRGTLLRPLEVPFDERIADAEVTISGRDVTTDITLSRNDVEEAFTDTRTIAAATNVRYDVLHFDPVTAAFGVTAGTDRATDAAEFIPAIASGLIPLFNLRVVPAAVEAIAVWNVDDGDSRALSEFLGVSRLRGRRCLRKTIQRIRRGQSIRIVGFGDSITAIASADPSNATPNGTLRDRATASGTTYTYLRDNIDDDVVDAISLFTSVQQGRADDGAGAVHTKVGWNWSLVAAMQAIGYTLGTDLFYDNFGVPGNASSHGVSGGSPSAWTAAAAALNPNLVVLELGINDIDNITPANTLANLIIVAQAFQAVGAEVVFMGIPRPRTLSITGWKETTRAVERTARYTNSAFLPLMHLFEQPHNGASGLSIGDTSVANAINHPGILEHSVIGRELTRLLLD